MTKLFRSRDFVIQVFDGSPIRLSINRTELNSEGDWKDGITWHEIQDIKRGCGYGDRDAVEAYPRDCDLVDVANIRHIWIVEPEAVPFFWRRSP